MSIWRGDILSLDATSRRFNMSSTTRQIPSSEWDHHKDTIVELYRRKSLKDVRAEMQNLHGFNAR